jgi:outer membrane lipoprotein LolB
MTFCGRRVWRQSVFLLAGALLLAGCVTPPANPLGGTPWESRRVALEAFQDWDLSGRISVISDGEGWHASLRWKQTARGYTIDIRNPLGQVVARIQGDGSGVQVRTSDGRLLRASDPDDLVEEAVGLRIPVSGLRYWVKGLPDPSQPSVLAGDAEGRLTLLEQDGWTIEYPDYTHVAGLDLPVRIRARQDALKVQVIVGQWSA